MIKGQQFPIGTKVETILGTLKQHFFLNILLCLQNVFQTSMLRMNIAISLKHCSIPISNNAIMDEESGNNRESWVLSVLRDCTIGLERGNTIEGCLQTGVWMSSRTIIVIVATIFSISSLSTTMLAFQECPQTSMDPCTSSTMKAWLPN